MFVMGVSMNSGFIGGFVYPTITMGTMAAVICFQVRKYGLYGYMVKKP